jgi:SAM-dependent methyltransferase
MYDEYRSTAVMAWCNGPRMSLERMARQYAQRWARHLPEDRDVAILDIGCGGGEFLWFLQQMGYRNTAGIDVSSEQCAHAASIGVRNVQTGDALVHLAAHRESYDVIVALSFLEHLPRQVLVRAVSDIAQALKPSGLLLAVVPNAKSLFGARVRYADLSHEIAFTPRSAIQLCALGGLEVVAIQERGPVVHGLKSTARWLLWQLVRIVVFIVLVAEAADTRLRVYTQDMILVARRRTPRHG